MAFFDRTPNEPVFQLSVNGMAVASSLELAEPLKIWKSGENADLPGGVVVGADDTGPFVRVEGLRGVVRGDVAIYPDTLTSGKSAELGRSHGFFVLVRGRLVNLDDALFGLPALSHATFNRFRMVVDAPGLDEFLASTREAVVETPAVELFRLYLREEFNAARLFYDSWVETVVEEARLSTRISRTGASLSARPLAEAIGRCSRAA